MDKNFASNFIGLFNDVLREKGDSGGIDYDSDGTGNGHNQCSSDVL